MHPEDLFLDCAGGGHIGCGEELVPAWAGGLCQVCESTT